jgi:hypothetical protein
MALAGPLRKVASKLMLTVAAVIRAGNNGTIFIGWQLTGRLSLLEARVKALEAS